MGETTLANVIADAIEHNWWQVIGVRAEHDPMCNGDEASCAARCPVPVQYTMTSAEAADQLISALPADITFPAPVPQAAEANARHGAEEG